MIINKFLFSLIFGTILTAGCGSSEPDLSEFYKVPETEEPDTPEEPTDPDATEMTIKAMSFNIRYAKYDDPEMDGENCWDNRKVAFQPMIEEQQPTIIGVQEARPVQLDYLETAWADYQWLGVGRNNNGALNDEFVPIFYNTKEVEPAAGKVLNKDWGYFWLSDTPSTPSAYEGSASFRIATWVILRHKESGARFFFINTHIDVNGTDEQVPVKQMVVLKEQLDRLNTENLPVILTGDFNKTLDAQPYIFGPVETMTNVRTYLNGIDGGVNSDNSPTYQGFGSSSGLIVDHIFCTEFTPEKYSVIKKEYEGVKYISDHYPILGTLTHKIEQEQ